MGGIFEAIEKTLTQYKVKHVIRVKLKVGELTNAQPDALKMAFEAYSKGTVCEGAELLVERIPVRGRCQSCQKEFGVKTLIFLCPNCGESRIEIIEGEELLLESLEVE